MRAALLLFALFSALGAAPDTELIRFSGDLAVGQEFRRDIAHGLTFRLAPETMGPSGWTIQISPQSEPSEPVCRDFAWVVMPPYRSYNETHLDTSYGWTAEQAVTRSPREFRFVLNASSCKREFDRLSILNGWVPAPQELYERVRANLGSSPQGKGKLWIENYKIGPAAKKLGGVDLGEIEWIKFRVEIELPRDPKVYEAVDKEDETALIPRRLVTGVVENRFTGKPIPAVALQLYAPLLMPKTLSNVTDNAGRFRFENVPEGDVEILADKPGYLQFTLNAPRESRSAYFIVAGNANEFTVKLAPKATIAGRIVDSDGHPVSDVRVQLAERQLVHGRMEWGRPPVSEDASTDSNGDYRFEGLEPGEYVVHTLLKNVWTMSGEMSRNAYLPRYYSNAADFSSAQRLQMKGQDLRADFVLPKGSALQLSGVAHGLAPGGILSCIYEDSAGQVTWGGGGQINQITHHFVVPIIPGTWDLLCQGFNKPRLLSYSRQQVKIENSDVTSIPVELSPVAEIPVIGTPGQWLNQIERAALTHPGLDPVVTPEPVDPSESAQGASAILRAPVGRYRILFAPLDCLESLTYGTIDLMHNDLVVTASSSPSKIKAVQSTHCATISGTVHGGFQLSYASIVVLPTDPKMTAEVIPVAKDGKFGVFGIRPGAYRLYAFDDLEDLEYGNAEMLKNFPGREVSLEADHRLNVDLPLIQRQTDQRRR